MSDDLDLCLSTGETLANDRDHCRVDLRSCLTSLHARTPTVTAALIVPPKKQTVPESGLDLGAVVGVSSMALAAGLVAGALLAIAAR